MWTTICPLIGARTHQEAYTRLQCRVPRDAPAAECTEDRHTASCTFGDTWVYHGRVSGMGVPYKERNLIAFVSVCLLQRCSEEAAARLKSVPNEAFLQQFHDLWVSEMETLKLIKDIFMYFVSQFFIPACHQFLVSWRGRCVNDVAECGVVWERTVCPVVHDKTACQEEWKGPGVSCCVGFLVVKDSNCRWSLGCPVVLWVCECW